MKQQLILWIKKHRWLVHGIKSLQQYGGMLNRKKFIRDYLESHSVRKLQIGAHENMLPGWLNTDLYPQSLRSITLDATKQFPFPDCSFDYIFSEHQLEHISFGEGQVMLAECYRILKPGGRIRIALPSLNRLLDLFSDEQECSPIQKKYVTGVMSSCYSNNGFVNPCFALNAAFLHWGHRFLYDEKTLQMALENAGFSDFVFCEPGSSEDPNLHGIEFRTSEMDRYETVVLESRRSNRIYANQPNSQVAVSTS